MIAAGCSNNKGGSSQTTTSSTTTTSTSAPVAEATATTGAAASTEAPAAAAPTSAATVTTTTTTTTTNAGNTTASTGDPTKGKQIFAANCSSCHGATGTEGGVGPSLKNEKSRKNFAQAVAWIKNPQPPMPKLYPSPLNDQDVNNVASYVETL